MTILSPAPPESSETEPVLERPDVATADLFGELEPERAEVRAEVEETATAPVRLTGVALSAALTCLGGAWVVTRIFRGTIAAPAAALAGIVIGVGVVYVSHRFGRG